MRNLILWNMAFNAAYFLIALSEMLGLTSIHEGLPPQIKWIWICTLVAGNLTFHVLMLRRTARNPG